MDDYTELRHKNAEHARTIWVNWDLAVPGDDEVDPWEPPSFDEMMGFINSLIEHYQVRLGKRLFVEFGGNHADRIEGYADLVKYLHENNARVGMYTETPYDSEFWESLRGYVNQVCFLFIHGEHDPDRFAGVVKSVVDHMDVHINFQFDSSAPTKSFRVAKKMAESLTEITMNIVPPRGSEKDLTEDDYARIQGANAQVHRITAKNRKRVRKGHRGPMLMIRDDEEKEISPRELIAHGMNSWEGWTCMAGVEQLAINREGVVLRGWCSMGGAIGNVKDQMIPFPVSGIECGREECKSPVDIACTKTWY